GSAVDQNNGAPWYVVLPPDAMHVVLPSDPSLPPTIYGGLLAYVDSDDLDGFAAVTDAGLHLDLSAPYAVDTVPNVPFPLAAIVPYAATRLRITLAISLGP